jgi:hypothetical protein
MGGNGCAFSEGTAGVKESRAPGRQAAMFCATAPNTFGVIIVFPPFGIQNVYQVIHTEHKAPDSRFTGHSRIVGLQ